MGDDLIASDWRETNCSSILSLLIAFPILR